MGKIVKYIIIWLKNKLCYLYLYFLADISSSFILNYVHNVKMGLGWGGEEGMDTIQLKV